VRAVLAEAVARQGDFDAGLQRIQASLDQITVQQERVHLAEVLRLQGWMFWQQRRYGDAQDSLRAAINVAREQGTRSWELRAATMLARLLEEQGDARTAAAILAPIHDTFEEGLTTPDLIDATDLRERLRASIPS
jgi:ATP/maltotriose-dependent transcriptional regulator MalT